MERRTDQRAFAHAGQAFLQQRMPSLGTFGERGVVASQPAVVGGALGLQLGGARSVELAGKHPLLFAAHVRGQSSSSSPSCESVAS